jgi:hypothetical protein
VSPSSALNKWLSLEGLSAQAPASSASVQEQLFEEGVTERSTIKCVRHPARTRRATNQSHNLRARRGELGYANFPDIHHRVLFQVEIVFYHMEMARRGVRTTVGLAKKASGAAAVCKRERLITQLFCYFHATANIFPLVGLDGSG